MSISATPLITGESSGGRQDAEQPSALDDYPIDFRRISYAQIGIMNRISLTLDTALDRFLARYAYATV